MDTIDISQNIQDFKQVFDNGNEIIFSDMFVIWKYLHSDKFMKS